MPARPNRPEPVAAGMVAISTGRRNAYLVVLVVLPVLALAAAVAVVWGRGIGARDVVIAGVMYVISIFGIRTVGHATATPRPNQRSLKPYCSTAPAVGIATGRSAASAHTSSSTTPMMMNHVCAASMDSVCVRSVG